MASKVMVLSARSPVEAKSALIALSSRSRSSSPREPAAFQQDSPAGLARNTCWRDRHAVARYPDFVHVRAKARQSKEPPARRRVGIIAELRIDVCLGLTPWLVSGGWKARSRASRPRASRSRA